MGSNGNVDFRDLEKFRQNLEKNLGGNQVDLFIESCAKELAARLLAKVIKRTPVGQYPKSSGKKGGTLRRGWTNGKNQAANAYVNGLKVNHSGNTYVIEIINPVEYASYVEFGHRTRGGEGWVEGKFMLTISEQEIQGDAPRILENKLKKKLGECFK
jgi:hypothetical protein